MTGRFRTLEEAEGLKGKRVLVRVDARAGDETLVPGEQLPQRLLRGGWPHCSLVVGSSVA